MARRRFGKRVRMCSAVAAVAAFALSAAPSASAQEVLDANCPGPPGTLNFQAPSVAQTFTALHTGQLTRAQIDVLTSVAADGQPADFVLAIHTVDASGVPANNALASTIVPDPLVAGRITLVGVFAGPANVVAGQEYALVVSRPRESFRVPTNGSDPCPGVGALFVADSDTSGFRLISENADPVFAVFVTLPTPAKPSPAIQAAGTCNGQPVTIIGTPGPDEIRGTAGRDVIASLGGADAVSGLAGNDLICGGNGQDTLKGGNAKDKLLGQKGADTLKGGGGNDTCKGGKGSDLERSC